MTIDQIAGFLNKKPEQLSPEELNLVDQVSALVSARKTIHWAERILQDAKGTPAYSLYVLLMEKENAESEIQPSKDQEA